MTSVIFQPTGNAGGRDHYVDTIANPVPLDQIASHLTAEQITQLRHLATNDRIAVWGVTPGINGVNERKWQKVASGDVAIFLRTGRAISYGTVCMKVHAPGLAKELWGTQADGQTWEYVYFIVDVQQLDIPYAALNAAAGYASAFNFLAFMVLEPPRADDVIALIRRSGASVGQMAEPAGTYAHRLPLDLDVATEPEPCFIFKQHDLSQSSYRDSEGRQYQFDSDVPGRRQVFDAQRSRFVYFRPSSSKTDEAGTFFGYGRVTQVLRKITDSGEEYIAELSDFKRFARLVPLSEFTPRGWHRQNAIVAVSQADFEEIIRLGSGKSVRVELLECEIADDDSWLLKVQRLLEDGYGGVILSGPPGTGKSWYAAQIAAKLVERDPSRVRRVQFHPSYQYEDFVEGFRPREGRGFELAPRHLLQISEVARSTGKTCVLLIDELSRSDPARVFGEALTYVEATRRGDRFYLASGTETDIPPQLIVLATMNEADKGVDDVDAAFERRFARITMPPDIEALRAMLSKRGATQELVEGVVRFMTWLGKSGGRAGQIGHAYFVNIADWPGLRRLWDHQLKQVFERAYRLDEEGLTQVLQAWDRNCKPPQAAASEAQPSSTQTAAP